MASLTQAYIQDNSGLYRNPTNFSMGLGGSVGPLAGGVSFGQTSQTDDMHKSMSFKPQLYYEELKSYSFLNTLVSLLEAPILEGIDQIKGQIKVTPIDVKDPLQKDAAIIVNNFFEKCNFKQFLKEHLAEFILRGSYMAYINYKQSKFTDVMSPYDYYMIKSNGQCTWIIPNEATKKNNIITGASTMLNAFSDFYSGGQMTGMFANMFIRYSYKQETVKWQSREILKQAKENPQLLESVKAILGGNIDIISSQKLNEDTRDRLDKMTVLYSIERPVSILEPFLKKIFTLSIKEMVFDMLSLLQYLKADYFTINIRAQTSSDTAAARIATNVQAALNRYSIEFINSFEDPSGIIRRVYDKLLNKNIVLPMLDEFSDLQLLNIPDIEQRLSTLYQDIVEAKRSIADEAGIAQESVSGGANRWEAISRNEKMSLNIMRIKATIEEFVKSVASVIFFNHSNESFWDYRYNKKELPTTFHFANETHYLTPPHSKDFSQSLNGLLYGDINNPEVKDGNWVGINIQPEKFDFTLNLSTILDSYASKTKENVIAETIQSIKGVMDGVKDFTNYQDIIDPDKAVTLLEDLINIGDYTANIIDMEKLKQLFEQPPMQEQQMEEGMEEGLEEPAYFNYLKEGENET